MHELSQYPAAWRRLIDLEGQLLLEVQGPPELLNLNEYEKRSWNYLMRYLTERLQKTQSLFKNVLADGAAARELILNVAQSINDSRATSLSFHDLAERASNAALLSVDSSERTKIQVLFHIVGWLTGIWDPIWEDEQDHSAHTTVLEINQAKAEGRRGAFWFDQQVVRQTCAQIEEVKYRELHHVMGANFFGKLLPMPEQVLRPRIPAISQPSSMMIPRAYFSWQAVKLIRYRLEWTSTMNEHLQLDQRHKVLFVYQHPSLCWALYKRREGSLLSRFFAAEQREQESQRKDEDRSQHDFTIDDYLDDVLRSYLLLFPPNSPWMIRPGPLEIEWPAANCDPLLRDLCSSSRDNSVILTVMHDLETPAPSGAYVRLDEFPFLGKRLGDISEIGRGNHYPYSFWKLWAERFNPDGWTVPFVLLVVGLSALILQFPQTVASVWPLLHKDSSQADGLTAS